ATGAHHSYFGHDSWAAIAPGLKSLDDAVWIRRKILIAFEAAEREHDARRRAEWLTFVIVGGGPTGVELAGALGEIARDTLRRDRVAAGTILWAAGVLASSFTKVVAEATNAPRDRSGRIVVEPDLTVPGHPEVFVLGDAAHAAWKSDKPVPGVAQGAIQTGTY